MKQSYAIAVVLAALFYLPLATDACAGSDQKERVALLGPYQEEMPGFAFSDDGRHAIIGFSSEDEEYYQIDGKEGEKFESCCKPVFSSDYRHWAYAGQSEDKWWVVTDRNKYGPFDGIGGCTAPCASLRRNSFTIGRAMICRFSDDGAHFAYSMSKSGDWAVFLDGRQLGTYESLGINSLYFDPTGRRFAFWGKQGDGWYAVVDGKRLSPSSDDLHYDWVVFSPDGQHVLWASKASDRCRLIMDENQVFEGEVLGKPLYSTDGELWIAAVNKNGKSYLLKNGKQGEAFDKIVDGPILSPDGKHFALAVAIDGNLYAVHDGRKGQPFRSIGELEHEWVFMGDSPPVIRFSPDSQRLEYATRDGEGNYIVVDETKHGPYESILTIGFSADSKHFIGLVKKPGETEEEERIAIVVDGEQSQWYESAKWPAYSKNGAHHAYAYKTGDVWKIVLDGKEGETEYKAVNELLFGPTGELISTVENDAGKSVVIVGGSEGAEWDLVSPISAENIDEHGRLHYLAVSEGKIYRVERGTN